MIGDPLLFVIARSRRRRSNLSGGDRDCHAPTSRGSQWHGRLLPNVTNI